MSDAFKKHTLDMFG